MHLAIVTPYPPATTGIGQYGFYLSRALADTGALDRITVVTAETGDQRAIPASTNITVDRIWQRDHLAAGMQIVRHITHLNPDIVWFNLGSTIFGRSVLANISGLLAPGIVKRLGFPTVVTMHEMAEMADLSQLNAPGGPLRKIGARWVTQALTHADVICLTLRRYSEWLSLNRAGRCYMHIPIGTYHQPALVMEPSQPHLLFFSTIAPYKGLEPLLQTFRMLQTRIPALTMTIAGTEHSRFPGYLSQLQTTYASISGVRWMGYVPEHDVSATFGDSQVVVLPYTAATGSSSVLYQAMMCGRAVVASDLAELRAAVDESRLSAEFFHRGDTADMARAIERMLGSGELRRKQVAHNFQALRHLRPNETSRAYLRAFNLALRLHHTPHHIPIPAGITTESV